MVVTRVGLNLNFDFESVLEFFMNLKLNFDISKSMNLNFAFSKSVNWNFVFFKESEFDHLD